ncbi:MAG: nucleoside triphosphate pyrophosphatase [Flavobacteriaceae bacterium]
MTRIVLASTSATRLALLRDAGLEVSVQAPGVDEAAVIEATGPDLPPADTAEILAHAKAAAVSGSDPDAVIIGADQTLELDGALMMKAIDGQDLRRKLLALRGREHLLHSAVAVARRGAVVWSHVAEARMTMRDFSPEFLGRYVAAGGRDLLGSVGGYRIEGLGIQLFERIEGSHFAILGLPLLPLLHWLRAEGLMES